MVKRKYFSRGFSNAKKCVYKGIKFDSQLERDRYIYLKSLEDKGLIKQLKIQVPFDILDSQSLKGHIIRSLGKNTSRGLKYITDFVYYRVSDNRWVINDVKGRTSMVYKVKMKLIIKLYGMNYQIIETYRDAKRNNFTIY